MVAAVRTLLSLKETAVVADVPEALVRREIERRVVKPSRSAGHVLFPEAALLYFALVSRLFGKFDLSRGMRAELFRLLTGASSKRSDTWERVDETLALHAGGADVKIETGGIERELEERLRLLRLRTTRLHSDAAIMSGVPVFKGTRIPVDSVRGQLARGATVDALLEHYPRLARDDIALAGLLNKLGRPPGRPRKFKPLQIRRV